LFLVPLTKMESVSYAHKFRANQSLDCGEAEGSKGDAVRLKDGGF
jgi:hypothetical protein